MYVLVNKDKGIRVPDAFIPEIWESKVSFGGDTKPENVMAIFLDKKTAYTIKLKNNLDEYWHVLPVGEAFLVFGDKLSDDTIKMIDRTRFGFAVDFHENLENLLFYKRLVRLSELMSGHNWIQQIVNECPTVHYVLDNDEKCDHERAKELAVQILAQYSK
jgi:hypothetical protein